MIVLLADAFVCLSDHCLSSSFLIIKFPAIILQKKAQMPLTLFPNSSFYIIVIIDIKFGVIQAIVEFKESREPFFQTV